LTAGAFVVAYVSSSDWISFSLFAALLSVLIIGLVYDFYHMIIPDEISYGAAALAVVIVSWQVLLGGGVLTVIEAALGLVAAFLVYASLWYFSRGRAFGFGDAKLAVSLGALVGIGGVFSLVVLSFWIGAVVGVSLILWQYFALNIMSRNRGYKRVTMKSEVPFAPFLIFSFVIVYFFNGDVLMLIQTFYEAFYF
jgi:prepilin signal peptidase PulO-like enzyme (type II secretory pathway)